MTGFPWREAMQVGFGVMRLSSREFWGLTPRELAAAFEGIFGADNFATGAEGAGDDDGGLSGWGEDAWLIAMGLPRS